jgi:hypothetical protein
MNCQDLNLGANWRWVLNQLCSRETVMLRKKVRPNILNGTVGLKTWNTHVDDWSLPLRFPLEED